VKGVRQSWRNVSLVVIRLVRGDALKQYLLVVLCLLAVNADAACSNDTQEKNYPKRTIALHKKSVEGLFYYRTDDYAILVEPATWIRRLKEQVDRAGDLSDARLPNDIRSGTRSTQPNDLFALVLKDPLYFTRIELLLANVLQNGEASVVDAFELPGESRRFVSSTVLTTIHEQSYKGREFCTPNGDLLLRITDQID
jgi:hypothetical protein